MTGQDAAQTARAFNETDTRITLNQRRPQVSRKGQRQECGDALSHWLGNATTFRRGLILFFRFAAVCRLRWRSERALLAFPEQESDNGDEHDDADNAGGFHKTPR